MTAKTADDWSADSVHYDEKLIVLQYTLRERRSEVSKNIFFETLSFNAPDSAGGCSSGNPRQGPQELTRSGESSSEESSQARLATTAVW
jgi:hypothetical protein